jgi:NADPH:quinone reductase-like Zn-dependent oxidoreductase
MVSKTRRDPQMRAFTLDSFDSPPRLRDDLCEPRPTNDELLVRVHASSVNPADAAIAAGLLKTLFTAPDHVDLQAKPSPDAPYG